jgi:REP element-mobilizing transposase RayT
LDAGEVPVFLTWRLEDSLPQEVYARILRDTDRLPEAEKRVTRYREIEAFLDNGRGACLLRDPRCARAVQECVLHDHGKRYQLHAWCVMPNHVHVLLTPLSGIALTTIMRTLKAFSALKIRKLTGGSGRVWQPECFDRTIRDEEHFNKTLHYIEWNPVKAGLCSDPTLFGYSSANRWNAERIADP